FMPDLVSELRAPAPYDLLHVANLGIEGLALTGAAEAARCRSPLVITPFIHLGTADDAVAKRYVSMPQQRKLLRSASTIIVMTELEASFVISLGVSPDRVHISGVGVHPAEVTGGDGDAFRRRHGLSGKLIGT